MPLSCSIGRLRLRTRIRVCFHSCDLAICRLRLLRRGIVEHTRIVVVVGNHVVVHVDGNLVVGGVVPRGG